MYPEPLIAPMRQELTNIGIKETRTAADMEQAAKSTGTTMVVVNSVCGCAAGKMRPAVKQALQHTTKPDQSVTVFAGQDREATDKARQYFQPHPASSPSIGLLRDGKLVYFMPRHEIEQSDPFTIASKLTAAFDQFCAKQTV
jgi:putative YphP/YqiW family bacilliredoxin